MSATATGAGTGVGSANTAEATVYNGLGEDSSKNSEKSAGQATLDLGRSYGLVVVFAGLFAGFALVL